MRTNKKSTNSGFFLKRYLYIPLISNYYIVTNMKVGRCMSKEEFKELKETGTLGYEDELVPVFNSTNYTDKLLSRLNRGREIGNYFRRIGVRKPDVVAIMEIPNKAIEGPNQTNGLKEFLVPKGTPAEIIYKLNC